MEVMRVRLTIVYLNLIIILDTQNFNTNMKYKIGDKVRVREDLIAEKQYGKDFFVSEMNPFKGQIVTIKIVKDGGYVIEEDSGEWYWTEGMFSGKVSQDFSPEELVSQSTLSKEESSYDIITVKTNKVKLLLL